MVDGRADAVSDCQSNPASCDITFDSIFPPGQFGETEPNDNIVSADALVLGTRFWGQSYSVDDQDWYVVDTNAANQNLTVFFAVPGATNTNVSGWNLAIRDASGSILAQFPTSFIQGNPNGDDEIVYTVTLGLAGMYYISVEPVPDEWTSFSYNLAVELRDSPLDDDHPFSGFYNTEVEFNDLPSQANPLASGVTMHGLINLQFDVPVEQGGSFVWGQGEDDWFVYETAGNEIVTLGFCGRTCGPGDWFVDVYKQSDAFALENGIPEELVNPILAFNTSITDGQPNPPDSISFGLAEPGRYFARVDHQRRLDAPCRGWAYDFDVAQGCECQDGEYDCTLPVACDYQLPGCDLVQQDCIEGVKGCEVEIDTQGESQSFQPIGSCGCVRFGRIVEVPEGPVSGQYNFTWYGTALPPLPSFYAGPSAAAIQEVERVYVAFFGRPGDAAGVDYWARRLYSEGGDLTAIIDALANSQEYLQRIEGLDNGQLVDLLYQQLFNHAPDLAGRAYYAAQLDSGTSTPQSIALNVLYGATGSDARTIVNKVFVATYVTEQQASENKEFADIEAARALLATVGADLASVEAAIEAADAMIAGW